MPLYQYYATGREKIVISIDQDKFLLGHEYFERKMYNASVGVPFANFHHSYLVSSEIAYKKKIYQDAIEVLQFDKWGKWFYNEPGQILQVLRKVCSPSICQNLLVHRYGGVAAAPPLYKVEGIKKIHELEEHFYNLFLGGPTNPSEVGPRFDALANYLKDNHLGCPWAFMAYLTFLVDPNHYFPIRANYFDALLDFYGIEEIMTGYVTWEKYSILLELADILKGKLKVYGDVDAITIQSYMWVIAEMLYHKKFPERQEKSTIDFDTELKKRRRKSGEKERIGLLGELFVVEAEKTKLINAGRDYLVDKVRLKSAESEVFSYDVLSFDLEGSELHIEVKTTTRSQIDDIGFWLSEIEKNRGEEDPNWTLYRVWDIDAAAYFENIGNIVRSKNNGWRLSPSSWFVSRLDQIGKKI